MSKTPALPTREQLLDAQADRLDVLALFFGLSTSTGADSIDRSLASIDMIAERIYSARENSELWLFFTALSGAFPNDRDIEHVILFRDDQPKTKFIDWIVAASAISAVASGSSLLPMRIIEGVPFVDVSSCARFDRQTGIQRVERETMPLWARDHDAVFVAWSDRDGSYRTLREKERRRVLAWGTHKDVPSGHVDEPLEFVVPWKTVVVLPEVANHDQSSRLRGIARHSGNKVTAIGYDMIPMMSPELMPKDMGSDFLEYLGVIKYSSAVAGISQSATNEFHGFFTAVSKANPADATVVAVELPTEVPATERAVPRPQSSELVVLCVGSHEPRKNHGTVLHAAEKLWREGVNFKLVFLGGGGWGTDFDTLVHKLKRSGRPVEIHKAVTDAVLWDAYRSASFTVFPSLHEGFGLPIAESLAFGTPVIASNHGSTKEIADRGGCLLVDPRSDQEVFEAMRTLLTDHETYNRLTTEAASITLRSWDEYATDLWKVLVDDVS
jgi:glycosyltransferase involved in cell wall biosynthesis